VRRAKCGVRGRAGVGEGERGREGERGDRGAKTNRSTRRHGDGAKERMGAWEHGSMGERARGSHPPLSSFRKLRRSRNYPESSLKSRHGDAETRREPGRGEEGEWEWEWEWELTPTPRPRPRPNPRPNPTPNPDFEWGVIASPIIVPFPNPSSPY